MSPDRYRARARCSDGSAIFSAFDRRCGENYEYDVAAVWLSRLLRGVNVPVGIHVPLVRVAFQQSNEGYPLDDVVAWGYADPPAEEPCIQVQVKRSVKATAGNVEFIKVMRQAIGEWQGAAVKLGFFRALIVTGGIGSGRRTAALHLLNGIGTGGPIYEIAPTWDQPSTSVLPPLAGARYLLDMSDPTEKPPSADFGKKLLDWANEKKLVLVVTAADETGADRWARSAGSAAVPLQSPGARQLAERELDLTAAGEQRSGILDDSEFADIWLSAPKAAAVRYLVKLIAEEPFRSPEQIAKEYRGWRTWIEDILPKKKLGSRSLMWAAAFCDGGQRSSVLSMSEDLQRRLKENREPAAVLSDDPASKRLKDAELDPASDKAEFDPSLHGIAEALRAYLQYHLVK